jgi:hypothetical protein
MIKIPKGITKEEVYERRAIIIEELQHLIGTAVRCKALKNQLVHFDFYSIDETATHASKKYESTLAALNVTKAISNAVYIRRDRPHSKNQIKMRFNEIVELAAELKDIGMVKIIIGQRRNKKYVHYCITKKDS